MHLHMRFLAFEMAVFTAIAGMLNPNTPEWTKAYENRLICEMKLNLLEAECEQKAEEEMESRTDTVPTGVEAVEERTVVLSESPSVEKQSHEAVAGVCEEVVERIPDRPTMEAENEGHSQRLAQRAESEAVNEPQTSEAEMERVVPVPEATEASPEGYQGEAATSTENQAEDTVAEQASADVGDNQVCTPSAPLYTVDGERLDPGVDAYLYRRLCESGIGWFYPFALLIAYQESSFNPLAVNPNMRDYGLFQFRLEFHQDLDWQNPYAQVDLFVQQMAARAMAGCDPYTMISRHLMSDYGPYNQEYVTHVLSHLPKLRKE